MRVLGRGDLTCRGTGRRGRRPVPRRHRPGPAHGAGARRLVPCSIPGRGVRGAHHDVVLAPGATVPSPRHPDPHTTPTPAAPAPAPRQRPASGPVQHPVPCTMPVPGSGARGPHHDVVPASGGATGPADGPAPERTVCSGAGRWAIHHRGRLPVRSVERFAQTGVRDAPSYPQSAEVPRHTRAFRTSYVISTRTDGRWNRQCPVNSRDVRGTAAAQWRHVTPLRGQLAPTSATLGV